MKTQKNKRGFTLIELLVASTIIVVLASIGIVSFVNAGKSARDGKRKADLETVRAALVLYKVDNGTYPDYGAPTTPTNANYDSMISALGSYISSPTPNDPKDVSPYLYEYGGDPTAFTLEVQLEKTGADYELTNP